MCDGLRLCGDVAVMVVAKCEDVSSLFYVVTADIRHTSMNWLSRLALVDRNRICPKLWEKDSNYYTSN